VLKDSSSPELFLAIRTLLAEGYRTPVPS